MKHLALLLALLLGTALAEPMRLSAPAGTVSTYALEGNTRIRSALVSVRSLDGKGVPQGLRAAVEVSSGPPQILNGERTETILEQDPVRGAHVAVSQWFRSSALLVIGPRWQTEYTLVLSPQGQARAETLQVKRLDPDQAPQSDSHEAAVRQGTALGALQNVALEGYRYFSDFQPGVPTVLRVRREQLEAAHTDPQQGQDGPDEFVLGRLTPLERTPEGGYRFWQDLELVQGGRLKIKLYGRSELTYLPDGRLLRSSGVNTSVVELQPEEYRFAGRRFTVVRALVTRTESRLERVETP